MPAPERLTEAVSILRFLAENNDEVTLKAGDVDDIIYRVARLDATEAPGAMVQLRAELDRIVAEQRAAGRARAELFFLQLTSYGLPQVEELFALRQAHARAAELQLLDTREAEWIRFLMGENIRGLIENGLAADAASAVSEMLAATDAAGVAVSNRDLLMYYGEAAAVAGQGEQSDDGFRRAFQLVFAQDFPQGSRDDWFLVRSSPNDDALRLIANQWAFYLNVQGRFADAEAPGRYASDMATTFDRREIIPTQKARYNFGVALLGQGKAAEALPYFEEALPLQRVEESRNGWRPREARAKDTVLLLTTLARARAQVPGREGDALAAAVEAADKVRALREARLDGDDTKAAADPGAAALANAVARGDRRDPLSPAYDMVMLTGWATPDGPQGNIDVAFRAAQDLTLNEAGSAISQAAARDLAGDGPLGELVRLRQDTASGIIRTNAEYRTAATGSDGELLTRLSGELTQLGDELARLDARLDTEFPEYSELVAPGSVGVAAVKTALAEDEALVMLLPSEGHHYVFVVTREAARWLQIEDGAAEVTALVNRLRCRMDEATCSADDYDAAIAAEDETGPQPLDSFYPRFDQAAAFRLYQLLLAPLADVLADKPVVYTVAAGPVSGLPLAALVTAPPAEGTAQSGDPAVLEAAPWLGTRHAFVTLPSVSAITLPRSARSDRTGGLVGYGAPVLGGRNAAAERGGGTARERRRGGTGGLRAAAFFDGGNGNFKVDPAKLRQLAPLPGTERELSMMARSLESGEVRLRMGSDATETAVKQDPSLAHAEVVVFATHGLLPGEMGQTAEPGLVLTPPEAGTLLDDGLLTASEAAELTLAARWLILSACNTATPGGGQGAEALSGLARAFIYAGADSLLASHWRVSDDASAALTVQTIRAGQAGYTQAEALQAAQNAVRSGTSVDGTPLEDWAAHWAHPSAWAPFTLISDHNR